jgi:hypothetical protein
MGARDTGRESERGGAMTIDEMHKRTTVLHEEFKKRTDEIDDHESNVQFLRSQQENCLKELVDINRRLRDLGAEKGKAERVELIQLFLQIMRFKWLYAEGEINFIRDEIDRMERYTELLEIENRHSEAKKAAGA